jgi:hypothetical protein
MNRSDSDLFHLSRVAVMRGTALAEFQSLCRGRSLRRLQLRDFIRATSRRVLGNSLYDRMRQIALEKDSSRKD